MQIGLLWFIYNCLNIIPWEKNLLLPQFCLGTLIKNQLSWTVVGVQWLSVLSIHKVLRSASSTQKEGNDPWLITSMPVSCCFSQFCFAVSFGNHEHEFPSSVLSQGSFSYSQVRFPNSPQCARTWSGHSDGSPVEYAEQSQALSPYRFLIHKHKMTCHVSGFWCLAVASVHHTSFTHFVVISETEAPQNRNSFINR